MSFFFFFLNLQLSKFKNSGGDLSNDDSVPPDNGQKDHKSESFLRIRVQKFKKKKVEGHSQSQSQDSSL